MKQVAIGIGVCVELVMLAIVLIACWPDRQMKPWGKLP